MVATQYLCLSILASLRGWHCVVASEGGGADAVRLAHSWGMVTMREDVYQVDILASHV